MKTKNDNRMLWIRNIEKLNNLVTNSNNSIKSYIECEIASECTIYGLFLYEDKKITCSPSNYKDQYGLNHYLLRIKFQFIPSNYNQTAESSGYYFEGGSVNEILSLFSVYFQCRFYLLNTWICVNDNHGQKIQYRNDLLYSKSNPQIHPTIFDNKARKKERNFAEGLDTFLNKIRKIDEKYHLQFILSCRYYLKSLYVVSIDPELAYLRLVSSIESLSKDFNIDKNDNPLINQVYEKIFDSSNLSSEQHNQLKDILKVNGRGKIIVDQSKEKSLKKFVHFIEHYSKGCLKGGNWKNKGAKITRKQLPDVLKKIYNARSKYLHTGEQMNLSRLIIEKFNWDYDTLGPEFIDNKKLDGKTKLPYTFWFENLVRCCLLNYLDDKVNNAS